jgi:hypothetical protein
MSKTRAWVVGSSLVAMWLLLWGLDYGVLVNSVEAGTGRDCSYVIGPSVLVRHMNLIERCPLLRKV